MKERFYNDIRQEMNQLASKGVPYLFIIDFHLKSPYIFKLEDCASCEVYYEIEGISNYTPNPVKKNINLKKIPPSYLEFLEAFNHVQKEIRLGNSYLVNLTFPSQIETGSSLKDIFLNSAAPYKLLFRDQFVVFSPECFVKINGGKIMTFPMKGTIDASLDDAGGLLISDQKESAEHATIVDLLRNDLSIVAENVTVERYRYLQKIFSNEKTLLQASSMITGDIRPCYMNRPGDVIYKLLPAGSISGAPKEYTLKIIRQAENYERGYYTGVFGIYDGMNLNSGVMIRFIENQDGSLIYKSGGGITSLSDPESEYQELIDKIYVPVDRND